MKSFAIKLLLLVLALTCMLSLLPSCDSEPSEPPKPVDAAPEPSEPEAPSDPEAPSTPETPTPTPVVLTDFERYPSNTSAPTGHNSALKSDTPVTETFRATYKVQEYGKFDYKFFFSNNINSTYASGADTYRDMPTALYRIESAYVGTSRNLWVAGEFDNKQPVLFGGQTVRAVKPKETFWSDPISIDVAQMNSTNYLVFEWTVTYTVIPSTKISTTMAGMKQTDPTKYRFYAASDIPMPDLIGADRGAKLRIGFIGDSITMGEFSGATTSSKATYEFWAAQIADGLGEDVSVWNLGLGYARGDDAANSPSWLYKAKQCDVVGICFGVNDINSGAYQTHDPATKDEILADITKIAEELEAAGVEVIIFSIPPYTFSNQQKIDIWRESNVALKALATEKGYKFFDFAAPLADASAPEVPLYGGHPNNVGCTKVAEAFLAAGLITIPE